ncbi:MAG: HAMP domain-containing sensor histidine kinase [Blastocatellia bacterium]
MLSVKAFLKRHLLVVGFVAVIVPLLVLLGLQYRSLRTLETALPAWRKEEMTRFLREVVQESEARYRQAAEAVLTMPATAIRNRTHGVVMVAGRREAILTHLAEVTAHFQRQPLRGVKHYFVAVSAMQAGHSWAAILFYDPASHNLKVDSTVPEWFSLHLAFASYNLKILRQQTVRAEAVGIEQPPDHRFIFKPILDEEQRIVGITGMVVEPQFFTETILRDTLPRVLAKHFPSEQHEVAVTLQDADNRLLFSNQPGQTAAPEAQLKYGFLFRDWSLGVRARGASEAQMARRLFVLNISLSALMALLVSGGLWLALRTAAHEMKLSQMKSDFVSNVSHELRTPLSSIRVFGELLRQGRVTTAEMVQEFGTYIETESGRLTQLINKILDFSRIESGHKAYDFVVTDLREVVAETFRAEALRLKPEGFELRLALPPTPLPPVRIDTEAIAQAFVNLLDNAAKYSGNARNIEVQLAQQAKYATLAITDHGIGIASAEHEKIFEKFYRVGSSLVHDVKGSGLGLSIVRHVMEAHHGRITVTSKPGQGSVFTMWLPLEAEAASARDVRTALGLEGQ